MIIKLLLQVQRPENGNRLFILSPYLMGTCSGAFCRHDKIVHECGFYFTRCEKFTRLITRSVCFFFSPFMPNAKHTWVQELFSVLVLSAPGCRVGSLSLQRSLGGSTETSVLEGSQWVLRVFQPAQTNRDQTCQMIVTQNQLGVPSKLFVKIYLTGNWMNNLLWGASIIGPIT